MAENGFLLKLRRWGGAGSVLQDKSREAPAAIDVRCVNRSGGALVGAVAGSDVVALKLDEFVRGEFPGVTKPSAAVGQPWVIGVVHWGDGSRADNAQLWVRVFGRHPYVKVDGTTDVAIGDMLTTHSATAGALEKTSTLANRVAAALAARTDNSIGALACLLLDPGNLIRT